MLEKVEISVFEGLTQGLLEQILSLIEQINADDVSFSFKAES